MGAIYFIEPITTYDLDVLAILPETDGGLIDIAGLYRHLNKDLGFVLDGKHVIIGDVPVQFLPVFNDLLREALEEAVEIPVGGASSRVLSYEHLLAIMVKTGRPKDRLHLHLALESLSPDMDRLDGILRRHGLEDAWRKEIGESK